ncbi:MAG: mechanosensitive ion channel domain-containing protein [Jhaorihella sp.]
MHHDFLRSLAVVLFVALSALAGPCATLAAAADDPGASTSPVPAGLDALVRDAAKSGASVIVIDPSGRITASGTDNTTADAPPPDDTGSMMMHAQATVDRFRKALRERLAALPNSINEVAYILRATSPDGRIMTYVEVVLWSLGLFLAAGFVVRPTYGRRFALGVMRARTMENPRGYREKMPLLVLRFFLGVGGTILGMLLAYVAGYLILGPGEEKSIELTIAAVYSTFFIAYTLSNLWRMLLSPYLPQYRIPVLSDRDARRLYHWAWILGTYSVVTVVFSTWIADFGLNYNVYAILYGALSLIGALGNIAMILFNARAISNAIRGGRDAQHVAWLTRVLSVAWAPLLGGYIVFGWLELASDLVLEQEVSVPLIAGAYAVFLSIVVVYGVINYLIERLFDRSREVARINTELAAAETRENAEEGVAPEPRPVVRITTYEQLARRVAGVLAFVAGAYAMLRVWDPENEVLPNSVLGNLLDVITILFIGYVVYNLFRIWIDSKIAEEGADADKSEMGDEGGVSSASRLATLLPLFRGAILAVVVVSIGLIALLELGINVSPLFAGAGVVGLAIGFGAQTLVRDIFSGAFFLIDDAFRKGEYIDIGEVKGTVEKISVRSFQLRHHLGALNTIPFGEIKVLTNYSRDWVIMKLPLRVTYDTDVEKVRKLIKKLGQELLDDPVIGDNFIQPLKSQGVIEMQDNAMIIRVKFMTRPGDQWLVRKKVYEEIRARFAREGIHFAHREVTVRLADAKAGDLTEAQREAVAGAAQAVADGEDFSDMGPAGDDR